MSANKEAPSGVIVLEAEDELRQPTDEEVQEYAEFLGIKVNEEPHLFWIAKEGVVAPVPPPWKACTENGDDVFYFNFETGESVWDHPCDEKYRQLVQEERKKHAEKTKPRPRSTDLKALPAESKGNAGPAKAAIQTGQAAQALPLAGKQAPMPAASAAAKSVAAGLQMGPAAAVASRAAAQAAQAAQGGTGSGERGFAGVGLPSLSAAMPLPVSGSPKPAVDLKQGPSGSRSGSKSAHSSAAEEVEEESGLDISGSASPSPSAAQSNSDTAALRSAAAAALSKQPGPGPLSTRQSPQVKQLASPDRSGPVGLSGSGSKGYSSGASEISEDFVSEPGPSPAASGGRAKGSSLGGGSLDLSVSGAADNEDSPHAAAEASMSAKAERKAPRSGGREQIEADLKALARCLELFKEVRRKQKEMLQLIQS